MEVASMHRRKAQSGAGFTLIELLVVIAIIAILAAILFPVFAQAREKARAISGLSNLKQLDLGVMMYIEDYDEQFTFWPWQYNSDQGGSQSGPPGSYGDVTSVWFNAIYPYVKNSQIYEDPDDVLHLPVQGNCSAGISSIGGWEGCGDIEVNHGMNPALINQIMSYGMNEPLQFGQLGDPAPVGNSPTALASLQKPAGTMVIADAVFPTTGSAYNGNANDWTRTPDPNNPADPAHYCLIHRVSYPNDPGLAYDYVPPDFPSCNAAPAQFDNEARHTAGDNISFADGHAKYLKDSAITNDLYAGTSPNS